VLQLLAWLLYTCQIAQEGALTCHTAVRGVTTSREGWARIRRTLWQPPRPHGEQPRERVVGPLELFYDLAVVVLVAQAAHRLALHLTWAGVGQFAAVFTLVWIAWANGSLHHELHGHDDARARSTFLLQILVLAAMGASVPQAGGARGAAFAVAARGDRPEYRRASRLFVAGTAACAVLLAATALVPAGARVPAWGALDVAYLIGSEWTTPRPATARPGRYPASSSWSDA
jgi:low temperature requirement protein LtrA